MASAFHNNSKIIGLYTKAIKDGNIRRVAIGSFLGVEPLVALHEIPVVDGGGHAKGD